MDELAVSGHFPLVELAAGWILVCPTERLITGAQTDDVRSCHCSGVGQSDPTILINSA